MSFANHDYDLMVVGNDAPAELLLQMAEAFGLAVVQVESDNIRFRDRHQVELVSHQGDSLVIEERFSTNNVVLAMGGQARKMVWDLPDQQLYYPEQLSERRLATLPDPILVVGAGDQGQSVVGQLQRMKREIYWCDGRFSQQWSHPMCFSNVSVMTEDILTVRSRNQQVLVMTENGTEFEVSCVVSCTGRVGNTHRFDLSPLGLGVDDNSKLWCNEHGETWTHGVFAIGAVVGYPNPQAAADQLVAGILERVMSRSVKSQYANSFVRL